jgi:beta-1,4-mannosyltransferase
VIWKLKALISIESAILDELTTHDKVTIVPLSPPPKSLRSLPFLLSGPLKVLWQVCNLIAVMGWRTPRATWILLQNPPSIPTLVVTRVVGLFRGTSVLIDWHNYGWSILAGTRGQGHPFVQISKIYEQTFGRRGTANLTVTEAMAKQLRAKPYSVRSPIAVMHDRPADIFRPHMSSSSRLHSLITVLGSKKDAHDVVEGRKRLVVSSTSWTPDEDFQLLLDALVDYSGGDSDRTPILAVITGKGPQKATYEARVAELQKSGQLKKVEVRTAFLPISDYASLLASADLGVCLHKSSSGVDLPMKVVDMFGAGLPVVAYSAYESFDELVKEGVNGRGFTTSTELCAHLSALLGRSGSKDLERLRNGAMEDSNRRWTAEWDKVVAPMLGFQEGES